MSNIDGTGAAEFEALWRDAYVALGLGNAQPMLELMADDCLFSFDVDRLYFESSGRWRGRDGFKSHLAAFRKEIEPLRVALVDGFARGSRLAAWGEIEAVYRPTRRRVTLKTHFACEFQGRELTRMTVFLDPEVELADLLGPSRQPQPAPVTYPKPTLSGDAAALSVVLAAFARGDSRPLWRLLADDVHWRCAAPPEEFPFGGDFHGKADVLEFHARFAALFELLAYAPLSVLPSGDEVVHVADATMRARATGEVFDAQHVGIWRFRHGRIVAYSEYFDLVAMRAALPVVSIEIG